MIKIVSVSDLRNRYGYVKNLVDQGFLVQVRNTKTKVIDFIIQPKVLKKSQITVISLEEEFAIDQIINFDNIDPYEISKQDPSKYNLQPKYRLNH